MILSQTLRNAALRYQPALRLVGTRAYSDSKLFASLTTPNGISYEQPTGLYVGGKFVTAKTGKTFAVNDPSTEKHIVDIQEAGEEDVNDAVDVAEKAQRLWEAVAPHDRGVAIYKLADKIEQNAKLLASVETWDNGKAISFAEGDIAAVVACFRFYAGWADKIYGKVVEVDNDSFNYIRKEPIGVTAAVIPWNFPLQMLAWKIAPAIATGNAMLLKSAESTPLTALIFAKLVDEIPEIPKGLVSILSGAGPVGATLSSHPRIGKIAFTGSTRTGRLIAESAAKSNLKKVTLELGGKSPNIVFDDAKIETAIDSALFGIFYNQGEVCCAGTRLFVQEGIYDDFISQLIERTKQFKVGDPFDPTTTYGAQTNAQQFKTVNDYIAKGKSEARLLTGGNIVGDKGYFVEPTIFAADDHHASIVQEEIFGPVLSVIKFKDTKQAIDLANDTAYGLASGIHTTSLDVALYVANHLKAGSVWVNTYNAINQQLPFGGYKASGNGRELGEEVLSNYMEIKSVRIAGVATGFGAPKLNY